MKINNHIGATVVISATRSSKQAPVVNPSLIQSYKKDVPAFGGNMLFKHRLETLITNQMRFEREPTLEFPEFPKHTALAQLTRFMSKPGRRGFVMIISGSGIEDRKDEYKIKFIISQEGKEQYILLSFDELIDSWDHRTNKQTNKHFLLIADFCQAGAWVQQLKKLNRDDISIQASCMPEQSAIDATDIGAVFLNNWLFANNIKGINQITPSDITVSGMKGNFKDAQTPQFWGNAELVKSIYGLKVGFNDWKSLENAQNDKSQTSYYIGQVLEIKSGQSTESIPNGFGSIWTSNHDLVSFGIFKNGTLLQEYKGTALEGKRNSYGLKCLKVDSLGNLLYGVFVDGYLEGEGIFATSSRGRWTGNFVKGEFFGELNFVNQADWTFHVTTSGEFYTDIHKITDPDGNNIDFQLKKNKPNGKHWVVDEYCNMFQGEFADGKLQGEGKIITTLGYSVRAIFKNDFIIQVKNSSRFGASFDVELMGVKGRDSAFGKIISAKATPTNIDDSPTFFDRIKSFQLITPLFKVNENWIDTLGNFYFGTLENEMKIGFGIQVTMNGNYYEGNFANGKRDGRGKIVYANGNLYEGDFKNDKRDGVGKLTLANGDCYEADFSNGNLEGRCKLSFSSGNFYEGNYFNNHFEGNGKYIYQNGDFYEGDFKKGNFDGRGTLVHTSGQVYQGGFRNDKFEGKGKLKLPNGDTYEGDFRNERIEGVGKFRSVNGDLFEGDFSGGKKDGNGIFKYANGDVYQGQFHDDELEGPGIYRFSNGDVYEGNFKADTTSGKGKLKRANGKVESGLWEGQNPKKKPCNIF